MILDAKKLKDLKINGHDLYFVAPFGFETRSEIEGKEILIINIHTVTASNVKQTNAIIVKSTKFVFGGPYNGTFISREGDWSTLTNEEEITQVIRDFKLKEVIS